MLARKLCVLLAFAVLLDVQAPAQQFPPGFVDPAPLLAAAAREIGEANFRCVTFSGTGYSAAVGQTFEHAVNIDWPRIDQMANYTRTINWETGTSKETFDRKPGLNPGVLEVRAGMGRRDADAEEPPADAHHQRRVFMVHRRRRPSCRRSARRCRALPVGFVDEPSGIHQGRSDARREPQGLLAMGAD